jgi:hypothetical protein
MFLAGWSVVWGVVCKCKRKAVERGQYKYQ